MIADFYSRNRQTLYRSLPEGGLFAVFSGNPVYRTADDQHRFFANRHFVYLTGIDEPDCALMAWRFQGEVQETLFVRKPDPLAERYGGARISLEQASGLSGISQVRYSQDFDGQFSRYAGHFGISELQLVLESNAGQARVDQNHLFLHQVRDRYPSLAVRNALPGLAWQRSIKSDEELANIRRALAVTRAGILRMMQTAPAAAYEYELYAVFMDTLHRNGLIEPAFKPIVSAGRNNFFLHYDKPAGPLQDGDLCLTDVGAIVDYCCVDISRVFPRNGRFSERQRQIYDISLMANDTITRTIRPGMDFAAIDKLNREICFEGLKSLGLLSDFADIGQYVWHGCSHHIGFDVHDVGVYHRPIEPGMVFTMDTGIYVDAWDIGMRIEDNVLVTAHGLECLSSDIPRTIAAIEDAMVQPLD